MVTDFPLNDVYLKESIDKDAILRLRILSNMNISAFSAFTIFILGYNLFFPLNQSYESSDYIRIGISIHHTVSKSMLEKLFLT